MTTHSTHDGTVEGFLRADRDRLGARVARLEDALERIANSVEIGAASKQLHARMRAIFQEIAKEARAALRGKP